MQLLRSPKVSGLTHHQPLQITPLRVLSTCGTSCAYAATGHGIRSPSLRAANSRCRKPYGRHRRGRHGGRASWNDPARLLQAPRAKAAEATNDDRGVASIGHRRARVVCATATTVEYSDADATFDTALCQSRGQRSLWARGDRGERRWTLVFAHLWCPHRRRVGGHQPVILWAG